MRVIPQETAYLKYLIFTCVLSSTTMLGNTYSQIIMICSK